MTTTLRKENTMLIQLLIHQPRAIGSILSNTPTWVWALLAGLIALGASQLFQRKASLVRVNLLPVSMTALSVYGTVAALRASGQLPAALALWLLVAITTAVAALAWRHQAPRGTRYDPTQRSFHLPGSAVPLVLIGCIFLTKYLVGVELAMQPQLVRESGFVFGLAAVYGVFNGIFIARAARLWQLARGTAKSALVTRPAGA
jgi:hypothetical protein